jgi:hypothetical protein
MRFDYPEHVRDLWRLRQGREERAASMWTHPLGIELRVDDELGQLLYSQTYHDVGELLADTGRWKAEKVARGWSEVT